MAFMMINIFKCNDLLFKFSTWSIPFTSGLSKIFRMELEMYEDNLLSIEDFV